MSRASVPALPGSGPQHRKDPTVDEVRIPPAGDPFTSAGSLAHPSTAEKLAKLEERLAHELMGEEERQELRDRVLALRRRLGL
jgi:hypothetical protein